MNATLRMKVRSREEVIRAAAVFQFALKMKGRLDESVTAERSMKVAVDFSPRIREGTAIRRGATAEP